MTKGEAIIDYASAIKAKGVGVYYSITNIIHSSKKLIDGVTIILL